mmetsp:Transcript_24934/g.71568  ORF Transcript_24934/g.71568 Transcript_24934/m.71568 type:complete len:486 (+) Transcript_24934:310-1767(+)
MTPMRPTTLTAAKLCLDALLHRAATRGPQRRHRGALAEDLLREDILIHQVVELLLQGLGIELGPDPLPHDLALDLFAGSVGLALLVPSELPQALPFHIQGVDLVVLPAHLLRDHLPHRLLAAALALHVYLLVPGPQAVELALEVQVPLLFLLVLEQSILDLLLVVQDRRPALLGPLVGLLLDELAAHHELEGPLGAFLLLQCPGLHQPLFALGLHALLRLELLPALVLQLHVGLNARHDPLVPHVLLLGHLLLEPHLLRLEDLHAPEVQGFHLLFSRLHPLVLLLALALLLQLSLLFPLGLGALLLVELLLAPRLLLGPALDLFLLLVELLLGDLLLQLLPRLGLHLLALLLLRPLVVHLFDLPGHFLLTLGILVAFCLSECLALLQFLQLVKLGVQGILQPFFLELLRFEELSPLLREAIALQGQERAPRDAGVFGTQLELLAVAVVRLSLVRDDLVPGAPGRREEVPSLRLEEVIAQLHKTRR